MLSGYSRHFKQTKTIEKVVGSEELNFRHFFVTRNYDTTEVIKHFHFKFRSVWLPLNQFFITGEKIWGKISDSLHYWIQKFRLYMHGYQAKWIFALLDRIGSIFWLRKEDNQYLQSKHHCNRFNTQKVVRSHWNAKLTAPLQKSIKSRRAMLVQDLNCCQCRHGEIKVHFFLSDQSVYSCNNKKQILQPIECYDRRNINVDWYEGCPERIFLFKMYITTY